MLVARCFTLPARRQSAMSPTPHAPARPSPRPRIFSPGPARDWCALCSLVREVPVNEVADGRAVPAAEAVVPHSLLVRHLADFRERYCELVVPAREDDRAHVGVLQQALADRLGPVLPEACEVRVEDTPVGVIGGVDPGDVREGVELCEARDDRLVVAGQAVGTQAGKTLDLI